MPGSRLPCSSSLVRPRSCSHGWRASSGGGRAGGRPGWQSRPEKMNHGGCVGGWSCASRRLEVLSDIVAWEYDASNGFLLINFKTFVGPVPADLDGKDGDDICKGIGAHVSVVPRHMVGDADSSVTGAFISNIFEC